MKLEKRISRACKQAAVLRYVRNEHRRLVPVPPGQPLKPGQVTCLKVRQN